MTAALARILALALNTFRESSRNRAFIGLLVGSLAFILASLLISEMVVYDQRQKVIQDFGLFFISFAGVVISVVIGVLMVFKELERKTIYSLLSKPLFRHEFILGRYLGMMLVLLVTVVTLAGGWAAVMAMRDVPFQLSYLKAVLLVIVEVNLVAAVAILFSSFSTPILSGLFTLGTFILGRQIHLLEELLLARRGLFVSAPQLRPLGKAVVQIFPDLSFFDISSEILLEVDVSWSYIGTSTAYGLAYIVIFITLATVIFQRRDFV